MNDRNFLKKSDRTLFYIPFSKFLLYTLLTLPDLPILFSNPRHNIYPIVIKSVHREKVYISFCSKLYFDTTAIEYPKT